MREPLPEWPAFGLAADVRPSLFRARSEGSAVVLATLTAVEGGGPRPVGTQMAFGEKFIAGYFSGGCVEGDVADHARACLTDGEPRRLVYGQGSPWPDIRLLCGARIEIFLERVGPDDPALAALERFTGGRRPAVWISDGRRRICAGPDEAAPWPGAMVQRYDPVLRLVVFGADPTAMAIAGLGAQAGFETTLVRVKGPETPPPLQDVAYRRDDDPGRALEAIGIDAWTAVVVATHEMETDHAALAAALPSRAFYVGLLGARARLPERLARLAGGGVEAATLARLRAPIGLDIGGKAPWEVAVSAIGEIMAVDYARGRTSTSTTSPDSAAGAPGGRRSRASARAKTLTSEES